jgi:hypothetical protein
LPKLVYPIRVGEHSNSAFGLSFPYEYALSKSAGKASLTGGREENKQQYLVTNKTLLGDLVMKNNRKKYKHLKMSFLRDTFE